MAWGGEETGSARTSRTVFGSRRLVASHPASRQAHARVYGNVRGQPNEIGTGRAAFVRCN